MDIQEGRKISRVSYNSRQVLMYRISRDLKTFPIFALCLACDKFMRDSREYRIVRSSCDHATNCCRTGMKIFYARTHTLDAYFWKKKSEQVHHQSLFFSGYFLHLHDQLKEMDSRNILHLNIGKLL